MSAAQQAFGAAALREHPFVAIPSAVSRHSWNLLVDLRTAHASYRLVSQERLDLDPRLDPPSRRLP